MDEQTLQMMWEDEREALLRVAKGTATYADAVFLARMLNHKDLFDVPHLPPPNDNEPE